MGVSRQSLAHSAGSVVLLAALSLGAAMADAADGPQRHRGALRPLKQAAVATELVVRVLRVPLREGHAFAKGDVLVELDCRRPKAEYESLAAQHVEMKLTLDSQQHLNRLGSGGRNDLEIARARVDKVAADMRAMATRLDQCVFIAPFDGHVVEIGTQEHEVTALSRPLITIQDDSVLEVELIVDAMLLPRLGAGHEFEFTVDELGLRFLARVDRLGAAVDPVSRTIKLIALPLALPVGIRAGMSGTANFER